MYLRRPFVSSKVPSSKGPPAEGRPASRRGFIGEIALWVSSSVGVFNGM